MNFREVIAAHITLAIVRIKFIVCRIVSGGRSYPQRKCMSVTAVIIQIRKQKRLRNELRYNLFI